MCGEWGKSATKVHTLHHSRNNLTQKFSTFVRQKVCRKMIGLKKRHITHPSACPMGDYDCAASACVKKAWGILDDVKKLACNQQPCYLCGKNERRNREDISIRILVRYAKLV